MGLFSCGELTPFDTCVRWVSWVHKKRKLGPFVSVTFPEAALSYVLMIAWQTHVQEALEHERLAIYVRGVLSKATGTSLRRKIDTATECTPYQTEGLDKPWLDGVLCHGRIEMFCSARIPMQRSKGSCIKPSSFSFNGGGGDEGRPSRQPGGA